MSPVHAKSGDHIAIIGGGIIGALSAWYLSKAGFQITVIDKDRFGAACSHGNCGYICPSHMLPLCQPGAMSKSLKAMLKSNSPFKVKPRLSRDWLSWFWKFARQCNQQSMENSAASLHALLQSSMGLYRELVFEEGIECEWQERGLLFVHDSQKEFEAFAKTDAFLREEFGVGATPHAGDALIELEPALKPGPVGGWHYEDDCHLRPDLLLTNLRKALEARGVTFMENANVSGFQKQGLGASAIHVDGEELRADHFVVAMGAWTPLMGSDLGFRIPIQPGKGYSITTSQPTLMPKHPLIFEDSHVAITPMQSGYRIGSTMEFVGYDTTIHPRRLGMLRDAARKYLHEPLGAELQEEWYGWRPMTWDGKPIIDRSPALKNAWIASGHNMLGLSTATGTGKLVAELIAGESPHIDPVAYSVDRLLK